MRERFSKSGNLFIRAGTDPAESIREIFDTFDLKDFRDEIIFWLELSLTNDKGAYQEGKDREDVMDFCRELIKLVEAFYMLSVSGMRQKLPKWRKNVVKQKSSNSELSLLVDDEVIVEPHKTISSFCRLFSSSYVESEMLDLLDSVITYEGVRQVNRINLVLFYQCVRYLISSAYAIDKKQAKN
ncbi:hypothetical protein [Flavitalea sp.]|nr:hypothetical protein [Flavitalea sp.]